MDELSPELQEYLNSIPPVTEEQIARLEEAGRKLAEDPDFQKKVQAAIEEEKKYKNV